MLLQKVCSLLLTFLFCFSLRVLAEYYRALLAALPPMKLQRQLGVIGAYGYFELKLKQIANYAMLRYVCRLLCFPLK